MASAARIRVPRDGSNPGDGRRFERDGRQVEVVVDRECVRWGVGKFRDRRLRCGSFFNQRPNSANDDFFVETCGPGIADELGASVVTRPAN